MIFCGIQAAGKTTFYLERFFATHVRISMDLLRAARNRLRPGKTAIPPAGLFGTQKRLEVPVLEEGYDVLHRVELVEGAGFVVS